MPKLTLAQFWQSSIPGNLGYCQGDAKMLRVLNSARARLFQHGRWYGTVSKATFCVEDGCITWPDVVANVERIAVNGQPIPIQNGWYNFIDNLGHVPQCPSCHNNGSSSGRCGSCGCLSAGDQLGKYCTFRDIHSPKYIRLYPTNVADVGKVVLLQGYDQNKIPIRNSYTDGWVDGERVTLAMPFVTSVAQFSSLTGVQKAATVELVRAYQVTPVTLEELPLAVWGPLELNPSYRRTRLPWLTRRCASACQTTVDAIVKLAYQPVASDWDWLVIDNLVALEHGCRGEEFFAQNRSGEAREQIALAISELNHELRTMTGDRTEIYVDIEGCATFRRQFAGFR